MQLPATISKYELEKFLGGGMSHVYRARDQVLGRTVAVKILTEQGCQDEEAKSRFLMEAKMAGNIQHENIISIHDYGEENGRPFIVMEFLVGQDLRDAIKAGATGDLSNKLRIALQIAKALEYVHSKKIIHRDIKPENIHLDASGKAKLMDFGIAKSQGLSLTRTGFALGTPYYMSPEQVLGHPTTELVDVYAFGILLYELLVGTKPISGDTVERLFYQIIHEPINTEPLAAAAIPQPVIELVLRCAAKKPEGRPQSFSEVVRILERIAEPIAVTMPIPVSGPAKTPEPGSKKLVAVGLALLLLLAVGIGVYFALRPKPVAVATTNPQDPKPLEPSISTDTGEMLLVPAGEFLYGAGKEHVNLAAYYIDKTEVSNASYARFCQAKNRPLPPGFPSNQPDFPVTGITIIDAQEFAKWAGKRLPSDKEWEKAARGLDGRTYPWGDEVDPSRANVSDHPTPKKSPAPVSSMPESAGPFNTLHMTGNVWEFVDELRTPSENALESFQQLLKPPPTASEPWYIAKGGSFNKPLSFGVAFEWISVPARFGRADIGFRCVKDAR